MSTFAELKALNDLLLKDRVAIIKRHKEELRKYQNSCESLHELIFNDSRFYGSEDVHCCEICHWWQDIRDDGCTLVPALPDCDEWLCRECNDNPDVDCRGYVIMICMHPGCEVAHLNNYSKFKDYCSFDCYLYDNFYADSGMLLKGFMDDEWEEKDNYDCVMEELLKITFNPRVYGHRKRAE